MDPKTTALILVGYQNDYFAKDGILRGVVEEPNRVDSVLASSLAFIAKAAKTPMTIISTPIVLEPDYRERELGPRRRKPPETRFFEGAWGKGIA